MPFRMRKLAVLLGALGVFSAPTAWAGIPYPTKEMSKPLDFGAVTARPETREMSVTLALKLRNAAEARALMESIYTKGSPSYHRFLTPEAFRAKFAQTDEEVAKVSAHLAKQGLSVVRSGTNMLKVTGTPANMERAFAVSLHEYEVPATEKTPAFRYQAPTTTAKVPAELSATVDSVIGLNTRPCFFPHNLKAPVRFGKDRVGHLKTETATTHPPGEWTVQDFSEYYGVLPLAAKVSGEGRTLGIVTLASFTESDAFAYWKAVGLTVDPKRITIVNIDGGPGAPSDESGSDETTLDVEQSGGLAPAAKVVVYQAPNTNQGFLDAFVAAADANIAESYSTSWGAWEWFDNLANAPVTDPYTGETVSSLAALHEVLLQSALQGQSVIAASGDAGAYDANDGAAPPDYSLALSVDNPASDSYITGAGGTTLAGPQVYEVPSGTLTITVPHERVWGWDYLVPLCNALSLEPIACGIFPVGSGGGISYVFQKPFYQEGVSGIQKTQPDQSFIYEDVIPPQTLKDIPAYYAGRNVPDVSFNADPQTGYVLYYTSSNAGFGIDQAGGTSFVAPQLNGVIGLIGQYLHSRVGLLNLPLYDLARGNGYKSKDAPLNVIKYGNNDFYFGRDGYSPAVGVGTLNVTNFAKALKDEY